MYLVKTNAMSTNDMTCNCDPCECIQCECIRKESSSSSSSSSSSDEEEGPKTPDVPASPAKPESPLLTNSTTKPTKPTKPALLEPVLFESGTFEFSLNKSRSEKVWDSLVLGAFLVMPIFPWALVLVNRAVQGMDDWYNITLS
jgi:hypothetical protein